MRVEFAQAILDNDEAHNNQLFITGDLGYMALEQVRDRLGERFINAGVAEQNMVTVAAALASQGFVPWVYSISPFVTLRPYEQIRNDVCLHNLPVKLVGNGGGYGYGIMGATHHNLEDIGAMRILPNMQVVVPFSSQDVFDAVQWMLQSPRPNYLRLNMAAKTDFPIPPFGQWRKIKEGTKAVVAGTGPVVANLLALPADLLEGLEIWLVSIFPVTEVPDAFVASVEEKKKLLTIEEHNGQCGLNETLAALLLGKLNTAVGFKALYANGYPSGRYGDQRWHQEENGLAGASLTNTISAFLS